MRYVNAYAYAYMLKYLSLNRIEWRLYLYCPLLIVGKITVMISSSVRGGFLGGDFLGLVMVFYSLIIPHKTSIS